jgi:hypothetical protein
VLLTAFSPIDDAGTARTAIKNLKQAACADLEEYIAKFRILKDRTGITEDIAMIEYFMDGLNPKLLEKIFNIENVPVTLDGWYKAASKCDGQTSAIIRKLMASTITAAIIGKLKASTITAAAKAEKPAILHSTPAEDPDAMDIDRLTPIE